MRERPIGVVQRAGTTVQGCRIRHRLQAIGPLHHDSTGTWENTLCSRVARWCLPHCSKSHVFALFLLDPVQLP